MAMMLVDDSTREDLESTLGTRWEAVTDRVMGGVSEATLRREIVDGRRCLHLTGAVSLDNSGGFVQMALDLAPDGSVVDLSRYAGVTLRVHGNDEHYDARIRTADLTRPWQSYRAEFTARSGWHELHLPFTVFEPHRTEAPLDLSRVRRIGLVAIGRTFHADLAVSEIAFGG